MKDFSEYLDLLLPMAKAYDPEIVSLFPKGYSARQFELENDRFGEGYDIKMEDSTYGKISGIFGLNGETMSGKGVYFIFFEIQHYERTEKTDSRTGKQIFQLKSQTTSFHSPRQIAQRILVYHHCEKECKIVKTCVTHSSQSCPPSCKFSKSKIKHDVTNNLYLIEDKIRFLL